VDRRIWPAAVLALAAVAACGQPAGQITLTFVPLASSSPAHVRVSGLSSDELRSLRDPRVDNSRWQRILHVAVAKTAASGAGGPVDGPPIAGKYVLTSATLEFTPVYPFDAGRRYVATFDPTMLPTPRGTGAVRETFQPAASNRSPATTVVRVLPTSDVLPENLLRLYLEFSAPMAREHGRDFLKLEDERGREVPDAFLALDVDFWSPDGRRYTLLFDPGRVKRGILPNDLFGRALKRGHKYTIVVDPKWRDADGQPLAASFRRTFSVGPPDLSPLETASWRVQPPNPGTRNPVIVSFSKPLDHGLLQRALGVRRGSATLDGDIGIGAGELQWTFTPREPWQTGRYDLVVLSILEDPMGNRIGRPFDIDTFDRIDRGATPDTVRVGFEVR
jgi:hypothetical protein